MQTRLQRMLHLTRVGERRTCPCADLFRDYDRLPSVPVTMKMLLKEAASKGTVSRRNFRVFCGVAITTIPRPLSAKIDSR